MTPVDGIELTRTVRFEPDRCRIEDRLSGDLAGKTLLFSVRHLPGAVVRVRGLQQRGSIAGWGSDGLQAVEVYEERPTGTAIEYECDIEIADSRLN